jgi:hypothetical protein
VTRGSATTPQSPEALERTMRIVWIAMVVSQLVLFVVAWFAFRRLPANVDALDGLNTPLMIAAIAMLFVASGWRRASRSDSRLARMGQSSAQLPPPQRAGAFYAQIFTATIISLAIHEAIVLVGFFAARLSSDPMRMLPFLAVALMLDALVFPAPARLFARARELVPQLGSLLMLVGLLSSLACSFRGGDYTPMKKEPETPCSREAEEICKEKLGSADFPTCVAREKYRCEVVEEEQQKQGQDPNQPH